MNGERVFLDTNVLVYAYDRTAGPKHEAACRLLVDLWNGAGGILSVQVLQEFFVAVTRKVPSRLSAAEAREVVEDLLTWEVVSNDGPAVLEANDLQAAEKISFWDALIVAAARRGGAEVLLTEDFADGRAFGDLRVRNPFAGGGGSGSPSSWRPSGSWTGRSTGRPSFPAASSSGSPWPGPWPTTRPSSWPTSRPATSTRKAARTSWASSAGCGRRGGRSSWSPTTTGSPPTPSGRSACSTATSPDRPASRLFPARPAAPPAD